MTDLQTDSPESSTRDALWQEARRHADASRYHDALQLACELNRIAANDEMEQAIRDWRSSAFAESAHPEPAKQWPPAFPDPFPGLKALPEVAAADLTLEILAGSILHHGGLLVRGLVSEAEANQLAEGVDRALADFSAWCNDGSRADTPWFSPIPIPEDSGIFTARPWILAGGGALAADSPRMLFRLTELLERTGLVDMVAEYFSERPALSVGKTTLRKVPADLNATDWHQDGAFLGANVRSVNLWLALSPCGVDASAMDIVPRRLPGVVETGTHGAKFEWSVGHGKVEELLDGDPIASPQFSAGDALLFDHLFLHRTSLPPGRSKDRWAIESWMFAPSCYPMEQVPLAL